MLINQSMYALGAQRSCIRELFEYGLGRAAVVGAENVYDFSIGSPSVPPPAKVLEAFSLVAQEPDTMAVHGYTPAAGAAEARAAVAGNLTRRSGMTIRPENIFLTGGAALALASVLRALAVEGSEVVAIAPYFPEYRPFVEGSGSKFVVAPADMETFQINFPGLERCINEHTQAVLVNSPNNPSGAVYTLETLETLAALLREKSAAYGHPIYIVSDEPYRELVYDGAYVHYIPAIYPDCIICYSYSKAFSLPGERIGYFCIPDCVTDGAAIFAAAAGAARVMGHVCAPSLQQRVICQCADVLPELEEYNRNRLTLYNTLTAYGYRCVRPSGAFYLFVESPCGSAKEFSELAKARDVLVVPGDDFGCPTYFRMSTCVSYETICRSLPIFEELIRPYRQEG